MRVRRRRGEITVRPSVILAPISEWSLGGGVVSVAALRFLTGDLFPEYLYSGDRLLVLLIDAAT